MNAVQIYEKCKSKELMTSFNRSGMCISYASMKNHRRDLAKLAAANSSADEIPLRSHFSPSKFTLSAFDNFDHSDKSTLSGKCDSHDTVILCFKKFPRKTKESFVEVKPTWKK